MSLFLFMLIIFVKMKMLALNRSDCLYLRRPIHVRFGEMTVKINDELFRVKKQSFKALLRRKEIKEVYTLGCNTRRYEFERDQ